MRNPFRSEAAAFHFLLLTVAAFGIVAAASAAGGTIAAAAVWIGVSLVAVAIYARGTERSEPETIPHVGPSDERRVIVVAPMIASGLHRLANDVDREREQAKARAAAVVATLGAPHVLATSAVGEDPVAAVGDALRTFGGDEIVVLAGDDGLVEHLREHYALPVTQITG